MGTKEEQSRRSKEAICEALLQCLDEEAFRKITVKKIIDRAGVNRSTFYKYFLDKYDLLDYYIGQVKNEFIEEKNYDFVQAKRNEINNPVYSTYFRESESFIRKNSEIYRILWNSDIGCNLFEEMLEIQKNNILHAMQTDPYYTEEKLPYAQLYSNLFANCFMITIRWWIEHQDLVEFEQTSDIMKGNMEIGFFQMYRNMMENNNSITNLQK